jgi:carboxyl-terminal processing protease
LRKISLLLLLVVFSVFGQKKASACEVLSKINTLLQREHYHPKPVDDSLSVYVFDAFVDGLDPERYLFTKTEYERLLRYRLNIDNAILENNCVFFDEFSTIYKMALLRRKAAIEKVNKLPFDYHSNDSVKFSKKSFPFDLAETDLERVWKKRLRYEILEEISGMSDNIDSLRQNFTAIEKEVKARNFQTNLCKINSILDDPNGYESKLQNDLYNVFCSYFDPHSNYLTIDAKSSFMSALSTSNLSLGLDFKMNDKQEIIVAQVIPGGPSAKSEQIQKDDVIVKVSNKKGMEYWASCTSPDLIAELIYSDSNPEIGLTLRKKNGALLEVDIKKQTMKAVTNSVFSFIAEKGMRAGYVRIPSFYSDFESNSVLGCADDVAKEIIKLQQDHIDGLIIDLQDNGGGSMEEAIKLAGMFTDFGPVAVLSDRQNKQEILKDGNRGSVYNGPIVILVNGNSASASEFFAAAMQDYKRAVIAGSVTLGKASMQSILPLENGNEMDFVKVTLEKFYRITGDSHQRKGVVPDVYMPQLFDSIMEREKSFKTALAYDSIVTKARFQAYPFAAAASVIAASTQRVKNDTEFKAFESINNAVNELYNEPKRLVSLTLEGVFADVHKNDKLTKQIKELAEKENACAITNTSYEKEKIQSDAYAKGINDYEMDDVKHNPYLEETIAILRDINGIKK